jgi:hypothetical protein
MTYFGAPVIIHGLMNSPIWSIRWDSHIHTKFAKFIVEEIKFLIIRNEKNYLLKQYTMVIGIGVGVIVIMGIIFGMDILKLSAPFKNTIFLLIQF